MLSYTRRTSLYDTIRYDSGV